MPVTPTTVTPPRRHHSKGYLWLLITLVVAVGLYAKHQAVYDWWLLRNYQAPANVVALADVTTMTDQARHDFYVNHPSVEDKAAFNSHCPNNGGEQTIILGCYIPPQRGIYIYGVSDPQLKGVEEVTAAHEMLHSAYDRLSTRDRNHINSLLQDFYDHDLHDKRVLDTIASYKKTEPNDLQNEMHSIFGTEVATLPPALEAYYQQYFTNRAAVVGFAARYQQAFTSRQALINTYDEQLKTLKVEIDTSQATLDQQATNLDNRRRQLSQMSTSDPNGYNAQVDNFNAQIASYNALIASTKAKISRYNDLVAKRNAVAVEAQNLSQELNSHLQTQSAQ